MYFQQILLIQSRHFLEFSNSQIKSTSVLSIAKMVPSSKILNRSSKFELLVKSFRICNDKLNQSYPFFVENDCCTRQCCGTNRSFNMKIADNRNQEILRLNRPFRCTSCCCPCCLQELEVSSPPETPIGYVIQK